MRRARHYRTLTATLIIALTAAASARAADLHFIVFADTVDPSIGTAHDLDVCTSWARRIATNAGLTLRLQTLSGSSLTPTNARHMLGMLSPAADDTVCVIYTGHGYNLGNSEWPAFAFLTESHDPPVTFDEVASTLQTKQKRLLIVASDCCNVTADAASRPVPRAEPSGQPTLLAENYQRLFAQARGTILITASSKGQYSLGDPSAGGLFLNVWIDDLDTLAETARDITWDRILTITAGDVTEIAAASIETGGLGNIQPQQPHYVVNVEQVAGYTPSQPTTPSDSGDTSNPATPDGTDTTTGDSSDPATDNGTPPPAPAPGCGAPGTILIALTAIGCLMLAPRRRTTNHPRKTS